MLIRLSGRSHSATWPSLPSAPMRSAILDDRARRWLGDARRRHHGAGLTGAALAVTGAACASAQLGHGHDRLRLRGRAGRVEWCGLTGGRNGSGRSAVSRRRRPLAERGSRWPPSSCHAVRLLAGPGAPSGGRCMRYANRRSRPPRSAWTRWWSFGRVCALGGRRRLAGGLFAAMIGSSARRRSASPLGTVRATVIIGGAAPCRPARRRADRGAGSEYCPWLPLSAVVRRFLLLVMLHVSRMGSSGRPAFRWSAGNGHGTLIERD